MFTDGFASREFTLRPISLSPSIHIRDIDLILHFQTSFNNIMQSSLNQMCFQCTHFSTDDSIMVHKSSAPCHRHLAWIFTSSHSLRSWSALLGHNLGALLPSSASGSTSPSTWNILTSPGLPSLA